MTNKHYEVLTELSDFSSLMEQRHSYLQEHNHVLADLWNDGFLDFYTSNMAVVGCVFVAASLDGLNLYDEMTGRYNDHST